MKKRIWIYKILSTMTAIGAVVCCVKGIYTGTFALAACTVLFVGLENKVKGK